MNRQQRRGNHVFAKVRGSSSRAAAHSQPARLLDAQVAPLREAHVKATGQEKPLDQKEANQRPRSSSGRFQRSSEAPVASPAPLPPQVSLTRQQRRHQERMAAKAARAWSKATGGAGVTLIDGQEVSGES